VSPNPGSNQKDWCLLRRGNEDTDTEDRVKIIPVSQAEKAQKKLTPTKKSSLQNLGEN
jgi:hypothetical protein